MLNNTGVKTEKYGNVEQILFATQHQVSVGVQVAQALGKDVNGKKIAKAGTPVTCNLEQEVPTATTATAADVVGILLHDVDVTVADNNGALLLFGFVNTNRIDTATKALLTAEVKKALPTIKFVAR